MAMSGVVELKAWVHPSMKLPFKFSPPPFKMKEKDIILSLMEAVEDVFDLACEDAGEAFEMQISVLWNVKDHKKALNPNDRIGMHFADGDTFGLYGDVLAVTVPKMIPEEDKLPVLILTGFLGAGKTTLLNYILQEQSEKKVAVIENEFGEISIDDDLLQQNKKMKLAEKIVVMDNGCMCCTIRGDLEKGLEEILQAHRQSPLDAIVIETTGMADPVPIVKTFMNSPHLTAEMRLDGVLAVADAKHLAGHLDDDEVEEGKVNIAFQQVAFADKIILNKLDLVTTDGAIELKDRIRNINAFAKILPAVKGRVKLTELTNMRAHDMTNFVNEDIAQEAEVAPELQKRSHDEHHGHSHDGQECHEEHGGHGGHGGHEEAHGDHGHAGHEKDHEGHGHGGHEKDHEGHGHGGHEKDHEGQGHNGHEKGHEGHGHDGHEGGHDGHDAGHSHSHGHAHGDARHDARVNSFSIVREGEVLPRKLSKWMAQLAELPKEKGKLFRIKSIMNVKKHPFKHVFHAVMDAFDEDDIAQWQEGEKRLSKIVFIGKSLDRQFLTDGFNSIFE